MQVSTIGLDLAKKVFQVHGVDFAGGTIIRKQLRRGQVIDFFEKLPPCLVGMEACATAPGGSKPRASAPSGSAAASERLTGDQARFLKRQLSFPVSMMSQ